MKFTLKTMFILTLLSLLHSCFAVSTYDAPPETGQNVYPNQSPVRQNNNTNNRNNTIPEPGQLQMKSQSDDKIPEPGQLEMKTGDDNDDDDVPEPGQSEMKANDVSN